MISKIILRYYKPEYEKLWNDLAQLIIDKTDFVVEQVDHTQIKLEDFDIGEGNSPVSLDRFLSERFSIPYLKVSRRFDINGDVMSHLIELPEQLPEHVCLIDTDRVSGTAMRLACNLISPEKWDVLIHVKPDEDLIDVEDLVEYTSHMRLFGATSYVSTQHFFTKRTSLPSSLYEDVKALVLPVQAAAT